MLQKQDLKAHPAYSVQLGIGMELVAVSYC